MSTSILVQLPSYKWRRHKSQKDHLPRLEARYNLCLQQVQADAVDIVDTVRLNLVLIHAVAISSIFSYLPTIFL